jgi:dipeptidyl aminopeptidase/acylaminoacyl peptidase
MVTMARALLVAAVVVSGNVMADDNTFVNTDVFELEVAANPQISPDGSRIAYARRSMDIMTDRSVSNIWIIDADGRNHRPLLTGGKGYGEQAWSPSGDRLAYVTQVEGHGPQIHVLWMASGRTGALTNLRHGPGNLSWSPDGKQIAFSMFVPKDGPSLAAPPPKPKGAEWAPPVTIIEAVRYRGDGRGYLEPGDTHVFVLSADGGTPRQLTSGEFNHGGHLAWAPDSKSIILGANRQEDWIHDPMESELWSVSVASGEMTQLTERDGPDFAPTISPDGSKIAYLGFDDKKMGYHSIQVYIMDRSTGSIEVLGQELDRQIADVQWAGSSNRLYIQYEDYGDTHIATLTLGGKIDSVTSDVGGVGIGRPYASGGFSTANNGAFAYTAGRVDRPADVGVGRGNRGTKRVTNLNEDLLGHKTLAKVEEIHWKSAADGLEIQGWLATPPGFDPSEKYPLILEIHGGPFATYGPYFSPEIQLYASPGNVVLYLNPRGSTSYGSDFANEIHHNYPGQDYDDLMSGVDVVIERGYIDEDQLFVTGGSGGGVLTAWIVGKTDRFAAAVVAKPVTNWISATLTTDISTMMPQYWFADMPWDNPEAYWARSPLSLVGNVSTPTALMNGEQDHRTPITESEQYYQALKLRKIDTALIRIPEASHGIAGRPSHLIAKVDNILAWFARYKNDE